MGEGLGYDLAEPMAAERLGMKRTTLLMKMRTLQQSGVLTKAG